jgi:putative endonuclease
MVAEVRQRARSDYGGALASVSWRKRARIIRATRYLLERGALGCALPLRFDVFAVQGLPEGAAEVLWVKDAFRAT